MNKKFLSRQSAVGYLNEQGLPITKGTLQKFASVGGGPEYQIFGNKALYTPEALDAWAKAKLSAPRKSTSKAA